MACKEIHRQNTVAQIPNPEGICTQKKSGSYAPPDRFTD